MMARWQPVLLVLCFVAGCGKTADGTDASTDASGEAAPPIYCYQYGGPSTIPPGLPDAGLNALDCDGGVCVRSAVDGYWYCAPKK